MTEERTALERIWNRIRAHPLIAGIVLVGSVVVGISTFTNSLHDLGRFFGFYQGSLTVVEMRVVDEPSAIARFHDSWPGGSIGRFPLLDVKLRNEASTASFLTAIDFDVTQRVRRPNSGKCARVGVSHWNYAVSIDAESKHYSEHLELSQSVPGNGVDRFIVVVGQHWSNSCGSGVAEYDMDLTLHYDRNSSLPLGKFPITIDGPSLVEVVSDSTRELGGQVGVRRITSASTETR